MGHDADGLLADPPDQLRAFIRDGSITMVPARRSRRRMLLDQVAQAFEPGRSPGTTLGNRPRIGSRSSSVNA